MYWLWSSILEIIVHKDFDINPWVQSKKSKSKHVIARRHDEAICCSKRYRLLRFACNDEDTFLDWTHLFKMLKIDHLRKVMVITLLQFYSSLHSPIPFQNHLIRQSGLAYSLNRSWIWLGFRVCSISWVFRYLGWFG